MYCCTKFFLSCLYVAAIEEVPPSSQSDNTGVVIGAVVMVLVVMVAVTVVLVTYMVLRHKRVRKM